MDTKAYIIAAVASIPAVLLNETIKSFTEDKEKFKRIRNLFLKYSFFSLSVLILFMFQLDRYDNPIFRKTINEEQARFYLFLWLVGGLLLFLNRLVIGSLIKKIVSKLRDLFRYEINNKNSRLLRLIFRFLDEIIQVIINIIIFLIAVYLLNWMQPLQRVTEFKNLTEVSVVDIEENKILYNISIPENTKFEFIYQKKSEKNYDRYQSNSEISMVDSIFILKEKATVILEKGTEIILPSNKQIKFNKEGQEIVESVILTTNYSKGQLNKNLNVQLVEDSEIQVLYIKDLLYYVIFEAIYIFFILINFYLFKIVFINFFVIDF